MQTNKLKTNKFSQGLKLVALFAMVLSVVCCSKKNVDEQVNVPESAKNFVSADDAKSLLSEVGALTKSGDNSKFAEIETVTQVGDAEGNAVFYAVNYQGGGFILLSADNRMEPVLAFSDTNTFSVEAIPETGVSIWAAMTTDQISEIRRENLEQSPEVAQLWQPTAIARGIFPGNDDREDEDNPAICPNPDETIIVGPLLETKWHQSYGFNDLVPVNCGYYDKAPVGCVPVAMGQIMKYYNFPTTYDWSSIMNTTGSIEVSKLLLDIGTSVNVSYGCTNSGVASTVNYGNAFKNSFGYRSAIHANYDMNTVQDEIMRYNRPVILDGYYTDNSDNHEKGHAWVCDGFMVYTYCLEMLWGDDNNVQLKHTRWTTYHMNMKWGQINTQNDGFYKSDRIMTPDKYPYYGLRMVYGIVP